MNFVTRIPILTNWKDESYKYTLIIIDRLLKMVYYKIVKVIINTLRPAKVILK